MRDGVIIQLGTPKEIITNPSDDFVEEFTKGIPKGKVINIENIITKPVVVSSSSSIENTRAMMDQAGSDYAIGIDNEAKYLGVICREGLSDKLESDSDSVHHLIDSTLVPVYPNTTLDEALHSLSNQDLPIPVVDQNNTFIGVATHHNLLKILAGGK